MNFLTRDPQAAEHINRPTVRKDITVEYRLINLILVTLGLP